MSKVKYKRVLLKLGGEALSNSFNQGIDVKEVNKIADDIKKIWKQSVQIGIVIGGGNIFRGISAEEKGMERVTADYMGMLATVINALALQDALERKNVWTRVQTSIEIEKLAEPYIRRRAIRHMEKGRVVIFAAGTGSPYFSTDTAAALRAIEIEADIILKATKVDGVYDKDPLKYKNAKKYKYLKYMDAINKRLKIMDSTALSLCMDNNIPIIIFSLKGNNNIQRVICGESLGTIVSEVKKNDK